MAKHDGGWALAMFAIALGGACHAREPGKRVGETSGAEQPAQQVACGRALCGLGQVCCNPSCGTCAAPDGMCTQQFCDERPADAQGGEPPTEAPAVSCENVRCDAGTHCELVRVQCVRAPCEPVPECVSDAPARR